MKYNAEDIVHQEFERRWRGYDQDQVHEFLHTLSREWDFMTEELLRLQSQSEEQAAELREFRRREGQLLDALSTAKDVATELERKATERGERIVEEARRKADQIAESAERQQHKLLAEIQELQRQRGRLDRELRAVLEVHLQLLDDLADVQADEPAPEERGPTIHRSPRTQPPTSKPTAPAPLAEVDEDYETLVGVMPTVRYDAGS